MSEGRLLLERGSDRERALLRAGMDEAPSAESVRVAARVLGIAPRAALAAVALGWLGRSAAGWKGSAIVAYGVVPAVAVGALVAVLHVAGTGARVTVAAGSRAAPAGPGLVPPALPLSTPSADSVRAVPSVAAIAPAAAPLAAAALPAAAMSPGPAASPSPKPAPRAAHYPAQGVRSVARDVDPGLEPQVALLDRARARAAASDASGALRALDEYDRAFPQGPLSEEAAALRIEATAAGGDRSGAAALAARFLAERPRSVHAARVRSFLQAESH
jgi:hypothetical protein